MPELSTDGVTFMEFEFDSIKDDEAIAIEDLLGIPWLEYLNKLNAGSIKAQKALVWLMQRRDNPELKFEDVSYEIAKFEIRGLPDVPLPEGAANNGSDTAASSPTSSESDLGSGST